MFVSVSVSRPLPDRNVGSRGGPGPGPGPVPNFNRSTEDLRMKQQSANYGRLRKCLSMGSQFVVSTHMHGCTLRPETSLSLSFF